MIIIIIKIIIIIILILTLIIINHNNNRDPCKAAAASVKRRAGENLTPSMRCDHAAASRRRQPDPQCLPDVALEALSDAPAVLCVK